MARYEAGKRAVLGEVSVWRGDDRIAGVKVFEHDEDAALRIAEVIAAALNEMEGN